MKYKTIRNLALTAAVAVLPYVCDNGCAYSSKKANAATIEVSQEARETTQIAENLELKIR